MDDNCYTYTTLQNMSREITNLTNSLLKATQENLRQTEDLDKLRTQNDKLKEQVANLNATRASLDALNRNIIDGLTTDKKALSNEVLKLRQQVASAADLKRNPCVDYYWHMRRSLENLLGWDCSVRPGEGYDVILAEVKDRLDERRATALKLDAVRKAIS